MAFSNVHVPHSSLIAFVYRHVLYRDPALDDVLAWSAEIENGLGFDAFVGLVAASDEASSAAEIALDEALSTVGNLFYRALGRHPSAAAVADWQSQMKEGRSLASLVSEILDNPETRRTFDRPTPDLINEAITFIYRHALGRQPTDGDLRLWSNHFEEGLSLAHIMHEIRNSDEGRRRSSLVDGPPSKDAISFVYLHALGRAALDEDLRVWSGHLSGGVPFERFLLDLLGSDEAQANRSANVSVQSLSDASFIAYLYEVCFGRGALASELELWKSRIAESGYGRRDLAFWFVETAILEEMREPDAGRQESGTVSIMGTDQLLNTEIWKTRAGEIRDGRNSVQTTPLSAPYVVRPHVIRVSAIASLYKGGRYIRQFLDNMVQQSLGENFELLVIDANSPDGEYDIIKEYQSVWPNIRYERINYRIGIYDAWNVAVGLARGECLTNTNLDDLRRRDSLELQAETLDAVPFADVVYQDFFYSLNPELNFDEVESFGFKSSLPLVTPNNLLAYNSPHNAPMWRKRLHSELGLFDTSLKSAGDHEFWLRCLQAGKVFYKINTPHVVYYVNPDGISTRPGTTGVSEGRTIQRRYGRKLIAPDLYLDQESLSAKLESVSGLPEAIHGGSTYERIQKLILSLADGS